MNIPAVNFCGKIMNKYAAAVSKSNALYGLQSDTYSFSPKKTSYSKEEVLEEAKFLKEEMEDCFKEAEGETTLAPVGVKSIYYDPEEDTSYMTLEETKDVNGYVTGKSAVFKGDKVSEIKIYKTKDPRFLGSETYYFDTKTGELQKYKAKTKEGYFKGTPINVSNITETEYDF